MMLQKTKQALKNPRISFGVFILLFVTLIALFGEYLIPYAPTESDISQRLEAPSVKHFFGCDLNGVDLFSLIILGTKTSLYVAYLTLLLSFVIGTSLGLMAGFFRGSLEMVTMRIVDVLMAFPGILLAMTMTSILGPSLHNVIFAIAATGWTSTTRLVHSQVLSVRERDYILAAKTLGAGPWRIMIRHIFPNILSSLIVSSTFSLSGVILIEASLSFLGLGASNASPSWGSLLNQGKNVLSEAPHLSVFPGICIAITVLALNFLGDGLRDFLDPKETH